MQESTPSLTNETNAVKEAYAALNRNDVAGFVAAFDPEIERIEPSDVPQDGIFFGLEAVKEHVSKARNTWAEGGCYPEQFIVFGDQVIVLVHVRVRLKSETQWRDGRNVDVFTFRNGKAIQFRTFFDEKEAFAWCGIKD